VAQVAFAAKSSGICRKLNVIAKKIRRCFDHARCDENIFEEKGEHEGGGIFKILN